MYSHVFAHLSKHNILCDLQHGFQQSRSCETQLIITINDVIFLDFSKAFDKVSHQHLFHHYGIRGDLLT